LPSDLRLDISFDISQSFAAPRPRFAGVSQALSPAFSGHRTARRAGTLIALAWLSNVLIHKVEDLKEETTIMKRACLSIFAVLCLLLTHLQPIVFGQSRPTALPATQTTRPFEPASELGDKQTQPGDRAAQTTSTADPAVEKVRHAVEKTGMAQKITVFLKNGDALHGAVTKIDRDEFAIAEVDFQRIFTIQYKDVKKIRSGYGGINLISGKRASPPQAARIAAMASAFFLVLVLPIILVASAKD
jgi:sRNA-binding regulator protein Hfq